MSRILFSPVGITDPISNFRDGALLHICRYYEIDKVYLYMSKEIYEYHKFDNRYIYCLDKLGKLLGRKIEYEIIAREDLVDVHIFDYFIDEFRKEIKAICEKHSDDEIYVNVSSGTPAMKSALQVLAAFREYKIIPIQVATPERQSNPKVEEKKYYDYEGNWECNDDNVNHEDRSNISGNINFLTEIKKRMLTELINKYDYSGALTLAETMSDLLPEEFLDMLKGAVCRYSLDYGKAKNYFKKYNCSVFEVESSDKAPLAEFLHYLDIKVKRKEMGDFIRGITPIFATILERILLCQFKIKVDDYTYTPGKVRKWSLKKLENKPKILELLNDKYTGGFRESFVNSDSLITIIEGCSEDNKLINLCFELREIEEKVRNYAAHTIISITDEYIKKAVDETAESILNKIFKLTRFTDLNLKNDFFKSYDKMNNILYQAMNIL